MQTSASKSFAMVACTPQPEQRKIVFPEGEELSAPTAATLGGKNKTPPEEKA